MCVKSCLSDSDGPLAIYIDLDTLADIEQHARSNTKVELGGVLLGRARIDGDAKPFVWVTGNIRAEHFQATRGSFKFTHDTWSDIRRQHQRMADDTEIVGWYHTHPGFGVFLSGMDEFICQNFFARSHDVALVIDPIADSLGWFAWDGKGTLREMEGFSVTSHRRRRDELEQCCGELEQKRLQIRRAENSPDAAFEIPDKVESAGDVTGRENLSSWRSSDLPVLLLIGLQATAILVLVAALWRPGVGAVPTPGDVAAVRLQPWSSDAAEIAAQRGQTVYRRMLTETLGYDPLLEAVGAVASPTPAERESTSATTRLDQDHRTVDLMMMGLGLAVAASLLATSFWWAWSQYHWRVRPSASRPSQRPQWHRPRDAEEFE